MRIGDETGKKQTRRGVNPSPPPNQDYDIHPLAEYFRPMNEEEYINLKDSMRRHGFLDRHPVVIFEEKVLDGRNRYRAAKELGEPFTTMPFHGTWEEAENFVLTENYDTRQLDTTDKAMTALKWIGEIKIGRPEKGAVMHTSRSIKDAYIRFGVSERTIKQLNTIIKEGKADLIEQVEAKEISINKAYETVRPPKQVEPTSPVLEPEEEEVEDKPKPVDKRELFQTELSMARLLYHKGDEDAEWKKEEWTDVLRMGLHYGVFSAANKWRIEELLK